MPLNLPPAKDSSPEAREVVESLRSKGVSFWIEQDQLRYKAPRGVLSANDLQRLRQLKDDLMENIRNSPNNVLEIALPEHSAPPAAPLSFSQLAHWRAQDLAERRGVRQVVSAISLVGPLCVDRLSASINELVERHGALRTRIVVCDGEPQQLIEDPRAVELHSIDLSAVSERYLQAEIQRQIDHLASEPIDMSVGPLFGIRLLRLGADQHIVILALEHSIGDGLSLQVIQRDVLGQYLQTSLGREEPSVPPPQFAAYARQQRDRHPAWLRQHGATLQGRLSGASRISFPEDASAFAALARWW